jgi:hypothetical protein
MNYAMNRFPGFLILTLVVTLLSACTAEQFSRNAYEGARVHNESFKATPLENSKSEPMSYEQYEKERRSGSSEAR